MNNPRDGAHKVRAVHGAIRGKLRLRIVSVIGIRCPAWYEARRLKCFQPGLGPVRVVHQSRLFDAAFAKLIPSQLPEVIASLATLERNLEHAHANIRIHDSKPPSELFDRDRDRDRFLTILSAFLRSFQSVHDLSIEKAYGGRTKSMVTLGQSEQTKHESTAGRTFSNAQKHTPKGLSSLWT